MSSNTGIAVQITYPSSVDFDLALLNSGGGYIDLSTNSGTTDDVTSNGTSVGGSSVYIWVDRYSELDGIQCKFGYSQPALQEVEAVVLGWP